MAFKVVGMGNFSKEDLVKFLETMGIQNPMSVVKEAEKGRAICGEYRILAFR